MNCKQHAIGQLNILYQGKFDDIIILNEVRSIFLRAKERIQRLKEYVATPEVYRTAKIQDLYRRLRVNFKVSFQIVLSNRFFQATALHCSQVGDNRPLSYCEFSPNDQMVAVSSW